MFSNLILHSLRRMRRGRRQASAEYMLAVPEKYAEPAGSLLKTALELHASGWVEAAAAELRALARKYPENAALHALLGQVLVELGDPRAAEAALIDSRRLAPKLARELAELAGQKRKAGLRRQALGALRLSALLEPQAWETKSRVADLYGLMGRLEEAVAWLDTAYRQSARDSLRLKRLVMEPAPIYRSVEHLEEVRARYLKGLAELEQADLRIEHVLAEVNVTNFYLPYQGMNERETQARLARIFLRATPELGFVAPHCAARRSAGARLRLGIASNYFGQRHSIGIAYNELIGALGKRPDFELVLLCFSEDAASSMQQWAGERGRAVTLPRPDLARTRERLAALQLDVLLYTDIGMDPFTYYLAFGRYAPLQGVLGGHPLTTGIPNMDIFVSYEPIEAPEAQDHYSERLILLRRHAMGMEPLPALAPRSRESLGLPVSGNLYVCPLKLQKFHPDFDSALAGILDADPQAEIVLFEDHYYDAWDGQVRERLARVLGRRIERVTFMPWQKPDDFLSIIAACDVALDTFHFGAGTTAAMTLGLGRPMVTLPPAFQRGRATLSNYVAMGIDDCIASDREDYVRIAVRIGTDQQYRAGLRERLLGRAAVLFESQSAGRELGDRLQALYREQPEDLYRITRHHED
jgi:predicted O-linked N-acetylglucosamine transferase (SPINDLY family)